MKKILCVLLTILLSLNGLAAYAQEPAPTQRTLQSGSRGDDVLTMKRRLRELNYFSTDDLNDRFNQSTEKAVKQFQKENGLKQTGKVDGKLWALLFSDQAAAHADPTPTPKPTPKPTKAPPAVTPVPTAPPIATPAPAPQVDWPQRDEEGYLLEGEPFVYENDEEGYWAYLSASLQIIIQRCHDDDIPLTWFETDIRMRDGERFLSVETNPKRPGTRFRYPYDIATDNHFVLGFSDDFYGHRINRGQTIGVVIRDGQVIGDSTYRKRLHNLPNLDILAQLEDGTLKAYYSYEYSAQELLDMGVVNVFCFGPVLIRDGEIDPLVLQKYYETKSPRQALGMIGPGHYLLLSVQGRMKESAGTGLIRMAYMLKERGVTEALNLDGGNTMALVFRGRMLNKLATWKNKKFVRTVTSLIGVGVDPAVEIR